MPSTERGASRAETDIANSCERGMRLGRGGLRASGPHRYIFWNMASGICHSTIVIICLQDVNYQVFNGFSGAKQVPGMASLLLTHNGAMNQAQRCLTHDHSLTELMGGCRKTFINVCP